MRGSPRDTAYVALLRGVNNIGASKRVSMADLKALFESLGFQDVRTLLNSGNVVFSAPSQAREEIVARIENALASRLGLTSLVIVLAGREVAAAVRNPLTRTARNRSHLLVVVPRVPSDVRRLKPLLDQRWSPEALEIGRRVAWLWCAKGFPSPLWIAVDRALARSGTVRNMATFTKLLAMVDGTSTSP